MKSNERLNSAPPLSLPEEFTQVLHLFEESSVKEARHWLVICIAYVYTFTFESCCSVDVHLTPHHLALLKTTYIPTLI